LVDFDALSRLSRAVIRLLIMMDERRLRAAPPFGTSPSQLEMPVQATNLSCENLRTPTRYAQNFHLLHDVVPSQRAAQVRPSSQSIASPDFEDRGRAKSSATHIRRATNGTALRIMAAMVEMRSHTTVGSTNRIDSCGKESYR